jgi:hypothetical protein
MRRVTMMLGALAMVVGLLAAPVAAAPGGNAANAAKCEDGGYLYYTDAEGNPFKNEGQCTRYAARGGQLVSTADISFDRGSGGLPDGIISGTGFTPNSDITLTLTFSPTGETNTDTLWRTDATGAFSTGPTFVFCVTEDTTSVEVTATDEEGVSVTESFPFDCGV